jgi:geranylgeranyl pyrophosphate synthase
MSSLAIDRVSASLSLSLEEELHMVEEHGVDPVLFERSLLAGAREFLARPSKGFRARLIECSFALAGGAKGALPRACLEAIELLHGGSLIVDDIQDEAELRRGAPALHRLVGIPRALNTGNWLYFVALSRLHALQLEPARALELVRAAHRCLLRCHEGQALDLGLRVSEITRYELDTICRTTSRLKTGALMGFAARLGAEAARAPEPEAHVLERFGTQMGVALQMLDDLGSFVDETRSAKALEDLAGERVNWVWSWAREAVDEVSFRQLLRTLGRREEHPELCARLGAASASVGRERVRAALDDALAELRRAFAPSAALEQLAHELTRLERSYG